MDDRKTYMHRKPIKAGSGASSQDHLKSTYTELIPADQLTSTYTELNVRKVQPLTNTKAVGLTSTYSELNFRKDKRRMYQGKDPSIASGPGELPITAQTDDLTSTYSLLNLPKHELRIDEDEDPPTASGAISVTAQEDSLKSIYSALKLGKTELRIDEHEDAPTASRPSEMSVAAQGDGLNSTYSVLNLPKDEHLIEKYEDVPIASGSADMSVAAPADPHKQEPNETTGNRRRICLLCLVTFVLFVTVAGLSIHVSQTRQTQSTCDRNFQIFWEEYHEMNRTQRQCRLQVHELNSTLESTISDNSHLNISQRNCLNNLSVLNSNLSNLKRRHIELRQQLTKMIKKCKSANEMKAQICKLLTSRREQTCSQNWISNGDKCYFISTFTRPYNGAKKYCSNSDSRLLEINSSEKENFVNNTVRGRDSSYWIGTCKSGKVASNLVYKVNSGKFECGACKSSFFRSCKNVQHRFICEKPATLCMDIPEKIRDLCQQPVEPP